ncbi:hypothetical protein C8Q77DRAFT_1077278 [Trametes polyzona]|nr:hypothetical protein C8Q77DRAFT_1077278 [Trametes polyzona]
MESVNRGTWPKTNISVSVMVVIKGRPGTRRGRRPSLSPRTERKPAPAHGESEIDGAASRTSPRILTTARPRFDGGLRRRVRFSKSLVDRSACTHRDTRTCVFAVWDEDTVVTCRKPPRRTTFQRVQPRWAVAMWRHSGSAPRPRAIEVPGGGVSGAHTPTRGALPAAQDPGRALAAAKFQIVGSDLQCS